MERHITDLTKEDWSRCGRGTTIVSMLMDDQIFTVSDGRNTRDGKIVSGKATKLYDISGRFIGTVAGVVEFGSNVIKTIKEGLRQSKGPEKIIKELQDDADKRNAAYLDNKKSFYPSQVGLNGFEGEVGHILLVDGQDGKPSRYGGRHFTISFSGSGTLVAQAHLTKFIDKVRLKTQDDVFNFLMQCVGASACGDVETGSCYQMAYIKKGGNVEIKKERPHLFSQLAKDFEVLKVYFKSCILHITVGMSYEEPPHDERAVQNYLKTLYQGIGPIRVLGVNLKKKKIVRVIPFLNEGALEKAMESEKKSGEPSSSSDKKGSASDKKGNAKKKMSVIQRKGKKIEVAMDAFRPSKAIFRSLSEEFDDECY